MKRNLANLGFLTILVFSFSAMATKSTLEISMKSLSPDEKIAKGLIEGLIQKYDLLPYLFTYKVNIADREIPHSHPILTMNTRLIDDPNQFLAVFIHEQIHWFFDLNDSREKGTQSFISKMKKKYPRVPSRQDGGAYDAESTYLHLGVCYYELLALSKILGTEKAESIFKKSDTYTWIRKRVLEDREGVKRALVESGLQWQDASKTR